MKTVSDPTELATRLVGGVWGHLVGDAVGVPYEFRSADAYRRRAVRGDGLTRAAARDVERRRRADAGAARFAAHRGLRRRGPGSSCGGMEARGRIHAGRGWRLRHRRHDGGGTARDRGGAAAADAGPADEMSCGNGSLMRILPVALVGGICRTGVDRSGPTRLEGHARASAGPGRVLVVHTRRHSPSCGRTGPRACAGGIARHSPDDLRRRTGGGRSLDHLVAWSERGGRGRVWDSFWTAWDAFAGARLLPADHRAGGRVRQRHRYDCGDRRRAGGHLLGHRRHPSRVACGDAWPPCGEPLGRSTARNRGLADLDDEPDPGQLGRPARACLD